MTFAQNEAQALKGRRTYSQFRRSCHSIVEEDTSHGHEYIETHSYRLFQMYHLLRTRLSRGSTVLSVGPGPSVVEIQLQENTGVDVTVLDRTEAIRTNEFLYKKYDIESICMDLATEQLDDLGENFDCIVASEVLEHLPLTAEKFLDKLKSCLDPEGLCVISTPNVANLYNILTLAAEKNIYESDQSMFEPEDHQYEPHRREYTSAELVKSFNHAGLSSTTKMYWENKRVRTQLTNNLSTNIPRSLLLTAYLCLIWARPRFRRTLVVLGSPS